MLAIVELFGRQWRVNLKGPIDLSIAVRPGGGVKAWYVNDPQITPVEGEGFVGAVALGGNVNFRDVKFNPHGHGTHTECVGHITEEVYSVNEHIREYFLAAQVITVQPETIGGDQVITLGEMEKHKIHPETEALVIRTLPNEKSKLKADYSNTNPAYLDEKATTFIRDAGINHLLIDLPSVDREEDGGALKSHNAFWNTNGQIRFGASITELIYVPDAVEDGRYLLNLQFPAIENDASPSRPLLFKLNSI